MNSTSVPRAALFMAALGACAATADSRAELGSQNPPRRTSPAFDRASAESVGWRTADLQRISEAVHAWVDAKEVVGAEFLILKDRKVILHDVAGWKDVERREPMEPGTIFCVRSMTKPIIGTAVQMLIDEHKLALDDKASRFLPSFDNERSRDITVEQMLTHRSGFPITLLDRPLKDYESHRALVDQAGAIGPHVTPGASFEYSDTNFETLAELVSIVSGRSTEEFVRSRILEPLAMRDTYCVLGGAAPDRRRVSSNYMGEVGRWEKYWDREAEPLFPMFLGAAGAYSTCEDYARFVAMWLDRGRANGRALLSAAAIERALRPIVPMLVPMAQVPYPTAFDGWRTFYGQAWMVWSDAKPRASGALPVFGHGGSDGTFAWVFPEQDVIALYFTQSRNGATCARFEELVASLVGIPTQPAAADRAGTALPVEALAPLVGGYRCAELSAFMFVRIDGVNVVVDLPGNSSTPLSWPDADGRWAFQGTSKVALRFQRDDHGAVGRVELIQGSRTYAFEPLSKEALPSVDELEALRGKARRSEVHSLHMHGTIELNKVKGEVTVNAVGTQRFASHTILGMADRTACVDGDHVSMSAPKEPREDLAGAAAEQVRLANPLGRLGDWRRDGTDVQVVDKIDHHGFDCWVVRVKARSMPTLLRLVDRANGRTLFEYTWQVVNNVSATPILLEFSDWRDVNGVDFPGHVERKSLLEGKLVLDYDLVETNVEIAPGAFGGERDQATQH